MILSRDEQFDLCQTKTAETIFQVLAPAVIAPPELQMDLVNFYKQETAF